MPITSTSPLQLESYDVICDNATGISTGSTGPTNATNVSGVGVLCSIGIRVSSATPAASVVNLEIQIDGGTTRTISIWASSSLQMIRRFTSDAGLIFVIPIGTRFGSSCRVGINVTSSAGSDTIDLSVIRGVKL